jgi:hypothetical protein
MLPHLLRPQAIRARKAGPAARPHAIEYHPAQRMTFVYACPHSVQATSGIWSVGTLDGEECMAPSFCIHQRSPGPRREMPMTFTTRESPLTSSMATSLPDYRSGSGKYPGTSRAYRERHTAACVA